MRPLNAALPGIERFVSTLSTALDRAAALVVLPATGVVVIVDVAMRYIFNAPLVWSLEFNEWMLPLIFALAIPECTRRNGHVRMDILIRRVSPRVRDLLDLVYMACAIWIFWLLAGHAWEEFLFDWDFGRHTEQLGLPLWLHQIAIVLMCGLLILYFVMRAIARMLGRSEFPTEEASPDEVPG